jgi:hypothetical protein
MMTLSRTLQQTPTCSQALAKMSVAGEKRGQSWRESFTKPNKTNAFRHGFLRKPVKALKLIFILGRYY